MRTLAALSFAALLGGVAWGQEATDATKTEPAPIQFQVLKSWRVDLGDRSIFLNRVAPPVLPAAPINPQQADANIAQADAAENLAAEKKSEVLFLSATVYDSKLTEIRWVSGDRRWSAFSNIDFNLLTGVGSFETSDTACLLILALENAITGTAGSPDGVALGNGWQVPQGTPLPSLDLLSPTHAQYLVVEDQPGAVPLPGDLAALDALHRHFDANRQRLTEAYAAREAARIEQEQRPETPPPAPRATVINFWKMDAASIQAAIEARGK